MSTELLYTSAPKGLRHGTKGYCTVLMTAGMPINAIARLEGVSDYRWVYKAGNPQNPVNYSHRRINVGGTYANVLSRIADYGIDYSGRENKIAHHLILDPNELVPAGPAWLLGQRTVMRSEWLGQCETPSTGPVIPRADQQPRICALWKSVTGDAGWGGIIAEAFAVGDNQPFWVIYPIEHHESLLELVDEAISLLPSNQRWRATFSTYATNIPPDVQCKVRFVPAGSSEAKFAESSNRFVNLAKAPTITSASVWVEKARGVVKTEVQIASPASDPSVDEFESTEPMLDEMASSWEQAGTPPAAPPPPPGPPELPPEAIKPKANKKLIIAAASALLLFGLIGTWCAVRMMAGLPIMPGNEKPQPMPIPRPEPEPEPPPQREIVEIAPIFATPEIFNVRYDQNQYLAWVVSLLQEQKPLPSPIVMLGKVKAVAPAETTPTADDSDTERQVAPETTQNTAQSSNNQTESGEAFIDARLAGWGGEVVALSASGQLKVASITMGSKTTGTFWVQQLPYCPDVLRGSTNAYWIAETNELLALSQFDWRESAGAFAGQKEAYEQSGIAAANLAKLMRSVAEQNKQLPQAYKQIVNEFLTHASRDDESLVRILVRIAETGLAEQMASDSTKMSEQLLEKRNQSRKPLKNAQEKALLSIVASSAQIESAAKALGREFQKLADGRLVDVPELKFYDSGGAVIRRIPLRFHFSW